MTEEAVMDIRINIKRLKEDIEALAQIGCDPRGGITRPSFSRADLDARQWLKEKITGAGLAFRQDGAGNLFGRIEGEGKAVMTGSHHDTVLNAGKFDGSAGVLTGLECLRRIKEEGMQLRKPLEVASFTDEEGNLVGDFLGSRAFVGHLNKEELEKGNTQFGAPFKDILAGTEFTVDSILNAHKERPEIDSYIELHIEQGTILETEEIPIGIVDRISGKQYRMCSFQGKTGHAGTTPLELRQDAFLGTADFALKSTQLVATKYYGNMVTIGKVNILPGTFSIVPGRVEFSLDFRSTSGETLLKIEKELLALAENIAATRGLAFLSRVVDRTEPISSSSRLIQVLKEECEKLSYPNMTMASGAGHDAQILAAVVETAMIFIPCADGISHSPEETIQWEDLEKGANLLLQALINLAS